MSDSMSPYQPPRSPLENSGSPGAPAPSRPTAIMVFGILNLVFAAMGFFGLCVSIVPFFMLDMGGTAAAGNPVLDMMRSNQAYYVFLIVSLVLGFIATVVLAAAGIGLLTGKSWGRTLSIGYGVYAIVSGIIGMAANWLFIFGPMLENTQDLAGPEQAGAVGGLIGGLIGGCIGLIYPILLIAFMTRPNIKQALAN